MTGSALWLLTLPVFAKEVTVHGFVTEIKSPTSFAIDDYKITRGSTQAIDVTGSEQVQPNTFRAEEIRVGTELEVKGDLDEQSGQLKVKSITVYLENTHTIKRTALLEQIPSLARSGSGWEGEIRADGERIRVLSTTSVTIKPNQSERKSGKGDEADRPMPLDVRNELNLDMFVRYEGTRNADGRIDAAKVELEHEEMEPGEAKLWKKLDPDVKPPDYSNFVPPTSCPASSRCTVVSMGGVSTKSFRARRCRTISCVLARA